MSRQSTESLFSGAGLGRGRLQITHIEDENTASGRGRERQPVQSFWVEHIKKINHMFQ